MNRMEIGRTSQAPAPSISPGGIVPLDSTAGIIQPGEWISIYGANLASETTTSNGDFPTSLGGTSVEINGKAAYLLYVSPGQINLQAPDDTALGTVSVAVTTPAGSATSTVTLADFSPAFSLLSGEFVSGIILRSNHSGAYGGGTYDILGPTGNSLGYPTVAAKAGDSVELFGVGFGPTTPTVPAGQPFSGAAPINQPHNLYINYISVTPSFVGLSSAGLYQINLTVPLCLGRGAVPVQAVVGGVATQVGVLFSLDVETCAVGSSNPIPVGGGTNPGGGGGTFGFGGGSSGGFGGGSGGGSGGSARPGPRPKKPYEPRLRFSPNER